MPRVSPSKSGWECGRSPKLGGVLYRHIHIAEVYAVFQFIRRIDPVFPELMELRADRRILIEVLVLAPGRFRVIFHAAAQVNGQLVNFFRRSRGKAGCHRRGRQQAACLSDPSGKTVPHLVPSGNWSSGSFVKKTCRIGVLHPAFSCLYICFPTPDSLPPAKIFRLFPLRRIRVMKAMHALYFVI